MISDMSKSLQKYMYENQLRLYGYTEKMAEKEDNDRLWQYSSRYKGKR